MLLLGLKQLQTRLQVMVIVIRTQVIVVHLRVEVIRLQVMIFRFTRKIHFSQAPRNFRPMQDYRRKILQLA